MTKVRSFSSVEDSVVLVVFVVADSDRAADVVEDLTLDSQDLDMVTVNVTRTNFEDFIGKMFTKSNQTDIYTTLQYCTNSLE